MGLWSQSREYGGAVSSPAGGVARLLRGACLSALIVAVSATAHWLGGEPLPPIEMLAVLAVVLLPACVWTTGRRVGSLAAIALLAAGQVALHGAFSVLMGCAEPNPGIESMTIVGHAGHGSASMVMNCAGADAATTGHATGGAAMLAFHAVATLATAFLACGAQRLARWLMSSLMAWPPPARPVVVPRAPAPWRPGTGAVAPHVRAGATRRGPPRAPAALGAALA